VIFTGVLVSELGLIMREECWRRHLLGRFCGLVEQCHRPFGEVAAVADLPFVVDFDQHRASEAE
jgi:hypothetical protein